MIELKIYNLIVKLHVGLHNFSTSASLVSVLEDGNGNKEDREEVISSQGILLLIQKGKLSCPAIW